MAVFGGPSWYMKRHERGDFTSNSAFTGFPEIGSYGGPPDMGGPPGCSWRRSSLTSITMYRDTDNSNRGTQENTRREEDITVKNPSGEEKPNTATDFNGNFKKRRNSLTFRWRMSLPRKASSVS